MKTVIIHVKTDTGRVVDTSIRTVTDDVARWLERHYRDCNRVVIVRDARPGDLHRDEMRQARIQRNAGDSLAA